MGQPIAYSSASYDAWSTIDYAARVLSTYVPGSTDPTFYPKGSAAFLESLAKMKQVAGGGYMYMPQDVSASIAALVTLVTPVNKKYENTILWQTRANELCEKLLWIKPVTPLDASDCSVM